MYNIELLDYCRLIFLAGLVIYPTFMNKPIVYLKNVTESQSSCSMLKTSRAKQSRFH